MQSRTGNTWDFRISGRKEKDSSAISVCNISTMVKAAVVFTPIFTPLSPLVKQIVIISQTSWKHCPLLTLTGGCQLTFDFTENRMSGEWDIGRVVHDLYWGGSLLFAFTVRGEGARIPRRNTVLYGFCIEWRGHTVDWVGRKRPVYMSINWRMNVVNGPLYGLMLTRDYFDSYMRSNIFCNIFRHFVTFLVLLSRSECFQGWPVRRTIYWLVLGNNIFEFLLLQYNH